MKYCLLLLLALFVTACARPPEPLWTDIPAPEVLLERLSARSGKITSLDLAASVSVTTAGKHVSSQQFILAEHPDLLRVDALSGFGQLVMQLATDGDFLSVFLNTTSPPKFFHGRATKENFSRFVRLPLPPELLVAVILYDPPVLGYQQSRVSSSGEQLELNLSDGFFSQTFYFDGQLQLVGTDYIEDGNVLFSVEYSRFSTTDDFPRRIEVRMPTEDAVLAMRISDLVLNAAIPVTKFSLQAPDGIDVEPIP
ncbi:MAG: DUF4292 domain-containing protein [Pelovirga sp.]